MKMLSALHSQGHHQPITTWIKMNTNERLITFKQVADDVAYQMAYAMQFLSIFQTITMWYQHLFGNQELLTKKKKTPILIFSRISE